MAGFSHLTRCAELSEEDILRALEDRRSAKSLLDQLARIAQPGEGAPKVLHLLARMALADLAWIDGALAVEVTADGGGVKIDVLSGVGIGMQERLFPPFKMAAPFEEFTRMVDLMPRKLEPLLVMIDEATRLVLEADGRRLTSIPKSVAIAEDSLYRRKGSKPKLDPSAPPERRISSAKMRAVRQPSAPPQVAIPRADVEVDSKRAPESLPDVVIPTISAQSGRTIRPSSAAAPRPSSRKQTLRPDSHAVPPPIPAVPQAPRIPRVDSDEPGSPSSDRAGLRRRRRSIAKLPAVAAVAPAVTGEAAPKPRRGSKPKVGADAAGGGDAGPRRPKSSEKMEAARLDSTCADLDWEIPPTGMPPPNVKSPETKGKKSRTLRPEEHAVPPPIPGPAPTPRISTKGSRRPPALEKERDRTRGPRSDPRAEDTDDD